MVFKHCNILGEKSGELQNEKNKKKNKLLVFPVDSVTRKPRHKGIFIMWNLCHMTISLLWCYNLIILFTVGESIYKHKSLSWNCLRWILSSLSYLMSLKRPMFRNEISKANNKILAIIKLCMCLDVSWKISLQIISKCKSLNFP